MPVMPPYEPYLDSQKNIKECQLLIETVAKQEGLTVIDLFSELNRQHRIYAQDGLHPSREGTEIIAKKIYSAVTGDFGGLTLPYVFGNHMVIQRDKPVRIFGTGNVGDAINIKLSKYNCRTTVDGNGRWLAEVPALKSGGPYTLVVSAADKTIEFNDVMIGEVWFCAGQSNMAFQLKSDADADKYIPLADNNPKIRLLKRGIAPGLGKKVFTKAESEIIKMDGYYSGDWQMCSSKSAADFSAVGYYFALEMQKFLGVPIGIIQNAVGGAPMETYMPREAFEDENLYKCTNDWLNSETTFWHIERAKLNLGNWQQTNKRLLAHHPYEPTFIYYADIEEMMPYVIRGVIWYQGESNATEENTNKSQSTELNKIMFKNLITTWRTNWELGDFSFYYVQLPNMHRNWMAFRQMQCDVLNELPNLGMAVTIDIGDANNVHPKFKYEVGRRLSLWARAKTYGQKDLVYSGPIFKKNLLLNNKINVEFDSVGSGLTTTDGTKLKGFEIQDSNGNWRVAHSHIDKNKVIIDIADKNKISAIRYAWKSDPKANLANKGKLPASPFYAKLIIKEN
jgi:sialate O-acetylesterase